MADEGVYSLEPEEPEGGGGVTPSGGAGPGGGQSGGKGGGTAGGSSMGSAARGKPGSVAPGARIEAGGLLDDFDEDADFSDPGEGGVAAKPGAGARGPGVYGQADDPELTGKWPPLVTDASVVPVLGSPKVLGIAGGVLLVTAVVITAVTNTSARALIPPLITLYEGILHTGTGVVAAIVAARFAERRVNRLDLVAARMLVLVSLFLSIQNLNIPIPLKIEEHLLAAGAYYAGVLVLFRLPKWETGLIAGTHFILWVLMMIGSLMYEVNRAAPAAGGG
ncbi:MAG: hypothetical protein R3B68_07305 [Phycisphaerales bacterium]